MIVQRVRGRTSCAAALVLIVAAVGAPNAKAVGETEDAFASLPFPIESGTPEARAAQLSEEEDISVAQAEADLSLQLAAGNIASDLQTKLGDGFAGVWFDNKTGDFHIDIAPQTDKTEAEAVATEHQAGARVEFDSVTHTWGEVEAATHDLNTGIADTSAPETFRASSSPVDNAPRLEVAATASSSDLAKVEAASARSTITPTIVRVKASSLSPGVTSECAWPYCNMPFRWWSQDPQQLGELYGRRDGTRRQRLSV
jgi:hypothetical protein